MNLRPSKRLKKSDTIASIIRSNPIEEDEVDEQENEIQTPKQNGKSKATKSIPSKKTQKQTKKSQEKQKTQQQQIPEEEENNNNEEEKEEEEEEEKKKTETPKKRKYTKKEKSSEESPKITEKKKKKTAPKKPKYKGPIEPLKYEFGTGEFEKQQIKITNWNINGIRAVTSKNDKNSLQKYLDQKQPDIIGLNELKIDEESFIQQGIRQQYLPENYFGYYNFCKPPKKGYSGVAILSKVKPIQIQEDFPEHDEEGRTLMAEFDKFIVITTYAPHSGFELLRLDYRQKFDKAMNEYIGRLKKTYKKPVILLGDLNVCHHDIDLEKNMKDREPFAGVMPEERQCFEDLIKEQDMVDSFRHFYPKEVKYSYLSFFRLSKKTFRKRIDYAMISTELLKFATDSIIDQSFYGSDHVPIELDLDFSKK